MPLKKLTFNKEEFSKSVRYKLHVEEHIDLRTAEKKTGLSISTLSRLCNGHLPDINTFATICEWVGADPNTFFTMTHKK